jgi:hypothetical protein
MDEAIRAVRKFGSETSGKVYASAVATKDCDGKLSVQEISRNRSCALREAGTGAIPPDLYA